MGMKHWGKLSVIMLAVALIVCLCGCQKNRQPAITIIGGADGPTSIWISALGLPGGRTLEYEDIGFFTVREIGDDAAMLEISGQCMHSALAVKSVCVKKKRDSLVVYLKTSLCMKEGDSGAFRSEIRIPAEVNRVVLGTGEKEIWRRADDTPPALQAN
ncbi:MAG: sodium ion-translocating decarboxylase subunit beta [Treponemataceae bacterium]|nr:sodium ion-translocating decarboxylase subunit beta [Treponemataceae bacterium]